MDWGAFEGSIEASARSPEDAAALIACARRIVDAHGEHVRPKDVDAYVRQLADAGASGAELALAQRAGDALVRRLRASSSVPAPPPEPEPVRDPDETRAAPADPPPPPIPPEVLAKMPASYFAKRDDDDTSRFAQLLRRYAWALDAAAIVVGLLLFSLLIASRPAVGSAYDPTGALLRRAVGWCAGGTFFAGLAGFADRAGLLEGPLYGRFGAPTLRLRMIQARGLFVLRGVLLLVSCVLLVVLGVRVRPSAPTSERNAASDAAWPDWMVDLGVIARLPSTWSYERTQELRAAETPLRVAWLSDADVPTATHAIAITRGLPTLPFLHAMAETLAFEAARRTDGITCHEEPPETRAIGLCVRDEGASAFVLACADTPGSVYCVAYGGPGVAHDLALPTEAILREVFPYEHPTR